MSPKIREWTPRRAEQERIRLEHIEHRGKPSTIKPLRLVRDEARYGNRFPVPSSDLEWTEEHAEFYAEKPDHPIDRLSEEIDLGVTEQDQMDSIDTEAQGKIIPW